MSEVLKRTRRKSGYRYIIDVYDETSEKDMVLSSVTYLGDVGDKARANIKVGGIYEPHIFEIKNVKPYE